jgi:ribosome-associated translation inhibitor RaiA
MNFKIFGKQVKVGEVFSKYSEEILLKSVQKYFPNPVSSIISVSKKIKSLILI